MTLSSVLCCVGLIEAKGNVQTVEIESHLGESCLIELKLKWEIPIFIHLELNNQTTLISVQKCVSQSAFQNQLN